MVNLVLKKSAILLLVFVFACQPKTSEKQLNPRQELALEIEKHLREQILQKWFPLIMDEEMGGSYSDLNYRWELEGRQNKMIVSQSRHVWSASKAAEFYPDNPVFPQVAEHGYQFLKTKMWDAENGGFMTW